MPYLIWAHRWVMGSINKLFCRWGRTQAFDRYIPFSDHEIKGKWNCHSNLDTSDKVSLCPSCFPFGVCMEMTWCWLSWGRVTYFAPAPLGFRWSSALFCITSWPVYSSWSGSGSLGQAWVNWRAVVTNGSCWWCRVRTIFSMQTRPQHHGSPLYNCRFQVE